jgi:hypothetical protein
MRRLVPAGLAAALLIAGGAASASGTPGAWAPPFDPYWTHDVGSWPRAVAIGDVTGDGRDDVVMTTSFYFDPENDFRLFVFPQRPDGTLGIPTKLATRGAYGDDMGVAVGDLDGDGDADVAVATSAGVEVFTQRPEGLGPGRVVAGSSVAAYVRIADLDGDGRNDIVCLGGGHLRLLRNAGDRFVVSVLGDTPADRGLALGDVDGDRRLDIVHVPWNGPWDVTVFSRRGGAGDGWGSRVVPTGVDIFPSNGVDVGDVTGDGRADIVVSESANRPHARIRVLAQTADGDLEAPVALESYEIPETVKIHDVDGDGRQDVLVVHGGWNRAGLYLQGRDGRLGGETLIPIPYASHYYDQGLQVGDISSDGRPDLVIADYNYGLVVVRQSDPAAAAPTPIPSSPPALSPAPAQGDSDPPADGGAAARAPAAAPPSAPATARIEDPPARAEGPPAPAPRPAAAEVREAPAVAARPLAARRARIRMGPLGLRIELGWRGGSSRIRWTLVVEARRADGRVVRKRIRGAGAPGARVVRRLVPLGPGWRGLHIRGRLTLTDGERSSVRPVRA